MRSLLLFIIVFSFLISPILAFCGIGEISALSFLDEILAVMASAYIFFNFKNLTKIERRIVVLSFFLLLIGFLGTLKYHYQSDLFYCALDAFACIKCFVVYVWAKHYIGAMNFKRKVKFIKILYRWVAVFIVAAFFCGVISSFSDVGMSEGYRFGLRGFSFIYNTAAELSNNFYLFLFFLVLGALVSSKKTKAQIVVLFALIIWCMTLKSRALLFVALFVFMYYYIVMKKRQLKLNVVSIVIAVFMALFITGSRLEETYNNDAQPRTLLMLYGVKTMQDHFPLGAGFGSYGTDVACKRYSPLYYKYGFQYAYGLNPEDTRFAHDCYWPAIMGEFGIGGVILVLLILFNMYKDIIRTYNFSFETYMLTLFLMVTQVFASLPTSIFFQANTIFLFFMLPLAKIPDTRFVSRR